jgi:hypothetical protein
MKTEQAGLTDDREKKAAWKKWAKYPVIYEISTWVWPGDLSRKHGRRLSLATVPTDEWDQIASGGFDAVWFMGVWERSPAGIEISMRSQGLIEDFKGALPDFTAADKVGSSHCGRCYVVDERLDWRQGLDAARATLRARGCASSSISYRITSHSITGGSESIRINSLKQAPPICEAIRLPSLR